jgi:sugar/nucleoside kinase (ribokinase family)
VLEIFNKIMKKSSTFIDEDTIRLTKPKVLGIGEVVIDEVFLMDQMWDKQVDLHMLIGEKHVGGTIPAALVLLARLEIDCTFLTSLGRDEEAKVIKKQFKKEGIKVFAKVQKRTKINKILVDRSTGFREKRKGGMVHVPIKNIDRKFLAQFDLIVIDRHEREAFYEVMKKKRSSTKVLIDTSVEVSPFTLDMIKQAELPVVPIEVVEKLGEGSALHEGLKKLFKIAKKEVVVTCGELGSLVFDGERINFISGFDVSAIDVTGAGDVYRGGFCYGILLNWELKKCAEFANLVAGLQCTKIGNITAIPMSEEIIQFERRTKQKKIIQTTKQGSVYESLCRGEIV